MHYYCTCYANKKKKREVENGRTPFRKVQATDEGICLDCGYYAVSYHDDIDPEGGKLYNRLMESIKDPPFISNTKGGLSIKNSRDLKGNNDKERAD